MSAVLTVARVVAIAKEHKKASRLFHDLDGGKRTVGGWTEKRATRRARMETTGAALWLAVDRLYTQSPDDFRAYELAMGYRR